MMRRLFPLAGSVALPYLCVATPHSRQRAHTAPLEDAALRSFLVATHTPRRMASTGESNPRGEPTSDDVAIAGIDGKYHRASEGGEETGFDDLPSTEVRNHEDVEEDFDELEAASQEVHDLCYGMIAYLRRADPDATKDLFERRVKKRIREPVPEARRRLIHGHGDRGIQRRNLFRSEQDLQQATQLYLGLGEKLMLLLTKPVMDRLLESAGKGFRDLRSDGVHKLRKPLERASWRTFPHRWFKHAPFEVQQLRADIPQSAVLNTRFYRDHATLRYLFTLMEPQHPYRAQIEKRVFDITQEYDPVEKANRAPRQAATKTSASRT